MIPIVKVYKVDYDFLIKNYLDKSLWAKSWNIYVYRDMVFTIRLYNIDCVNDKICFQVKCNKCYNWDSQYICYPLSGEMTISMLKSKINGAIWELLLKYEEDLIEESKEYKHILGQYNDERDYLTRVAEEFLDNEGVTNAKIREAYIDKYVEDNTKIDTLLSQYKVECRYRTTPTTLLVFAKSIEDENRYNKVLECNKNNNQTKLIKEADEIMGAWDNDYDNTYETFYQCCEVV